jgi:hypothetical protein
VIPGEDHGPSWLRDYGFTDFGDIAADLTAMEEYAKKLTADVQANYASHLNGVSTAMLTRLPVPDSNFYELCSFMTAHHSVQDETQKNVYAYANGTNALALIAQDIGAKYRGTDAFAHARVADVQKAASDLSATKPPTSGES